MTITRDVAKELIKFFSNQFIDRNSKKLYDGEVVQQFLRDLNGFVDASLCNVRAPDGYSICALEDGHIGKHKDVITYKEW